MKNVVIVGAGKEGKGTFGDIFYENKWNITFIDKDENVIKVDNNLNKGLMIAKSPRIIVLEFKIIAVNDIRGAVDVNHIVTDPFINRSELN